MDGECVNGEEREEATASSCDANDGMMNFFFFFCNSIVVFCLFYDMTCL